MAIVFADKAAYLKFSRPELGDAGESIVGYFSLTSNRMTMYDLTGVEKNGGGRSGARRRRSTRSWPSREAVQTVATIVHEATHQIAFNCGLHTRLSDCPAVVQRGDRHVLRDARPAERQGLERHRGGQPIRGSEQFQQYLRRRPADSLETLIRDDKRFRDAKQGLDAYAEAWALTYFLIRQQPKEYIAYLKMLSQKKPLLTDSPEKRIEEFRGVFGDLRQLDVEFTPVHEQGEVAA